MRLKSENGYMGIASLNSSIRETSLVCNRLPGENPVCSSVEILLSTYHFNIRLCIIFSKHFPILGSKDIGLKRLGDGYIPSFGRQIILACFTEEKNSPLSEYLLNRTVTILIYTSGSFFDKKAEVSTLSVDFFGEIFFHSLTTSFNVILSRGILGR